MKYGLLDNMINDIIITNILRLFPNSRRLIDI